MTEMSESERATVDRFEAAEAAPESAVERVARAMYEADEAWAEESDYDFHEPVEWRYNHPAQEDYRRRASAAVTALSSPTDAGAR